MGILNVTPDSFSDGGRYLDCQSAIQHGLEMMEQGADLIDVGGESTRPGSSAVSVEEEISRVVPVVSALAERGVWVSIDTQKPEVARAALRAGAELVNDVSGMRDPGMRRVCVEAGCGVSIMHMQGTPPTMQQAPQYGDVVAEVWDYLLGQTQLCIAEGLARELIWIDPGFGFGKTFEHNLQLLSQLDRFASLGFPVLAGLSRKSFLGRFGSPEANPSDRLPATLASQLVALQKGARVLRVHDVPEALQIARFWAAVRSD